MRPALDDLSTVAVAAVVAAISGVVLIGLIPVALAVHPGAQFAWYAARAAGMLAYVLAATSVVFGIALGIYGVSTLAVLVMLAYRISLRKHPAARYEWTRRFAGPKRARAVDHSRNDWRERPYTGALSAFGDRSANHPPLIVQQPPHRSGD